MLILTVSSHGVPTDSSNVPLLILNQVSGLVLQTILSMEAEDVDVDVTVKIVSACVCACMRVTRAREHTVRVVFLAFWGGTSHLPPLCVPLLGTISEISNPCLPTIVFSLTLAP